jgi:hypothetical protein
MAMTCAHVGPLARDDAPDRRRIRPYEKARLVATAGVRERSRARSADENHSRRCRPEVVELARQLRKRTRSGKQRSLREIGAELAARGFVAEKTGRLFEAAQVARMLADKRTDEAGWKGTQRQRHCDRLRSAAC